MKNEQPIEDKYQETMRDIARVLDKALNGSVTKATEKKTGFVLLMFDFAHGGRMNYISNAQREDMLLSMKEFIARAEGHISDEEEMQ